MAYPARSALRLLIFLFASCCCCFSARRLATRDRWVVDRETGKRVKLACVTLPSHLEPMITEGLSRRPIQSIAQTVASQGFSCVRLTWATFMVTRAENQNLTVQTSLEKLGLGEIVSGIQANNPKFLQLSLIESLQRVVTAFGSADVMVVLDNHISRPEWCCGNSDGNGFFGDVDFDPDEWISGLQHIAETFRSEDTVVGMSLRNELRGPRQNAADWGTYMTRGAEAVHAANPDILVILSGLSFDTDLKFLQGNLPVFSFTDRVVYEFHWYAFTDGAVWSKQSANKLCGSITQRVQDHAGFLLDSVPLFMSEFGLDQRGTDLGGNRYINCALAYAAKKDLDWALWTLQGSYMRRNGQINFEETYGVFNRNWDGIRNPAFIGQLRPIQKPFQEPSSSAESAEGLYHPATGTCVIAGTDGTLQLDSCDSPSLFRYSNPGAITWSDGSFCVASQGEGLQAVLSADCTAQNAQWRTDPFDNDLQWSVVDPSTGKKLCLDGKSSPLVLTTECICPSDSDGCTASADPEGQWFQTVLLRRDR